LTFVILCGRFLTSEPAFEQISYYHDNNGWNKTSLNGMRVSAYLMDWMETVNWKEKATDPTIFNTTVFYIASIDPEKSPPLDYADVYVNDKIYRYVWQITVLNSTGITIPPVGLTYIDAATGQTLTVPQFI